jgi:hypothetical protein
MDYLAVAPELKAMHAKHAITAARTAIELANEELLERSEES